MLWLTIILWSALAGPPPRSAKAPPIRFRTITVAPRATGSFTLNVSPATIAFTATNPDSTPAVAGSASASLTWSSNAGKGGATWTLTVQGSASSFTNCPGVPLSAVTVSCVSASADGAATATCNPPFPLSTALAPAASGVIGASTKNYSVTINYTLADSWKYIAQTSPSCSLSLSYIATLP
jgi:predicted phage tail protein